VNGKVVLVLSKHHNIKMHGRVQLQLQTCLTSQLDTTDWLSLVLQMLYSGGKIAPAMHCLVGQV